MSEPVARAPTPVAKHRWIRRPRAVLRAGVLGAAILTNGIAPGAGTVPAAPAEMQLKAVFVLNFIRFVDWSSIAPQKTPGSLTICALASSEFASAVRQVAGGKMVAGRSIVFRFDPSPGPAQCQVLVVDAAEYSMARPALDAVRNAPVLTIGNGPGLIAMGGIFDLLVENRRVQFDANPEALRRAAIDVDTRVLRMSRNRRSEGAVETSTPSQRFVE